MSWGASTPAQAEVAYEEAADDEVEEEDDVGRRGQILWVRGLMRLQHQVRRALIGQARRTAGGVIANLVVTLRVGPLVTSLNTSLFSAF